MILLHWMDGADAPYPDYNTWHRCRDPNAVLGWALDLAVEIRGPLKKPQGVFALQKSSVLMGQIITVEFPDIGPPLTCPGADRGRESQPRVRNLDRPVSGTAQWCSDQVVTLGGVIRDSTHSRA